MMRPIRRLFSAALLLAGLQSSLFSAEALQEIVVRSGDTLWGIANYYLQDPKKWPEILKHNPQLTNNPTVALPGMKLRIPVMLIKEKLRAAELIYILKDVRYRKKQSNEWLEAKVNMELFNEDGLRTMAESTARIRFPTGEIVILNENSLIIIQPEKGKDTVQLMAGDVKARRSRVITAGGAKVDPLGSDAEYLTRVRQDKTELVLVYRGRVDVTAQGKTVRVPEGFGSEIKPLSPPADPVPLPKMPLVRDELLSTTPSGDVEVRMRDDEKALVLSIEIPDPEDASPDRSAAASAQATSVSRRQMLDKYHVQVDDDADFKNPAADRYFALSERFDLMKLGLPNGRYFWRIAFVDSLGMEGPFSAVQRFEVDLQPPALTVAAPHDSMEVGWEEEFVQVAGQTEPGCAVRVDERSTNVDADGRFSTRIYLHEGKNRIVVAARDPSGNEARLERVVYRLTPGRGKSVSRKRKENAEAGEEPRESGLAGFGAGLLTIGTIIGIVLLIIG